MTHLVKINYAKLPYPGTQQKVGSMAAHSAKPNDHNKRSHDLALGLAPEKLNVPCKLFFEDLIIEQRTICDGSRYPCSNKR